MRTELNLKDKSQMSKTNAYTDNFKLNLICLFPSVRAKLKKTLCPRTPCNTVHTKFGILFYGSDTGHSTYQTFSAMVDFQLRPYLSYVFSNSGPVT